MTNQLATRFSTRVYATLLPFIASGHYIAAIACSHLARALQVAAN